MSLWSRCPRTRSTPRSPRRWPERWCRSPPKRTTPSRSVASWPRSATRMPRPSPNRSPNPSPEPEKEPEPEPKPEPEPEPEARAEAGTQARTKAGAQAGTQARAETEPAAEAPSGDGSPYVTPLVRKLAAENDIDLASVKGTGVGGRIRKQDVVAAAEAKKAPAAQAPAAARRVAQGGARTCGCPCASARHHPEGQPDPSDHREEDARIPAGHSAVDADPRGRHDQDRGAAGTREERLRRARRCQPDVSAVHRPRSRSTR